MRDFNRCAGLWLLGLIGVLTTSACSTTGGASGPENSAPQTSATAKPTPLVAGPPTLSMEAIAINGKSLGNGPTARITASPGDIITAEIYLRDWSPNGELLSGYQASLLPVSFSSGEKGFIEPVDYDALQKTGAENPDNAFVDDRHPLYVHNGIKTLSLTDTRSEGYRWMSVVLQGKAPKCAQDGKRFYCATIKYEVSENAKGTFSLELDSDPDYSGLRKGDASPTDGLQFEVLEVKVR